MESKPVHKCLLCKGSSRPGDLDSCGQLCPRNPCQQMVFIILIGLTWRWASLPALSTTRFVSSGGLGGEGQQALWEKLPRIFWLLLPQPDCVYENRPHLQVRDGNKSASFAQPTPFPVCVQVQTRAHACTTATPRAYTQLLRSLLGRVQRIPNPLQSWM